MRIPLTQKTSINPLRRSHYLLILYNNNSIPITKWAIPNISQPNQRR